MSISIKFNSKLGKLVIAGNNKVEMRHKCKCPDFASAAFINVNNVSYSDFLIYFCPKFFTGLGDLFKYTVFAFVRKAF